MFLRLTRKWKNFRLKIQFHSFEGEIQDLSNLENQNKFKYRFEKCTIGICVDRPIFPYSK
jgi:hypothetical protein